MSNYKVKGKKKRKNKAKSKPLLILLIIVIGILIFYFNFNSVKNEKNAKTNLIIDNSNVTDRLNINILIENDVVYLSSEDIENFFDSDIFYDKQYDQMITSSYNKLASMPIGKTQIQVNSSNTTIKAGVIKKEETYYIPLSALEDVYNVKVSYSEKTNIVTVDSLDKDYIIATASKDSNVKQKPSNFSKTVAKVKKGESYIIANREDCPSSKGWTRVRTENGTIGYVKTNRMGLFNTIHEGMKEKQKVISQNYQVWKNSTNEKISDILKDYKKRERIINTIVDYIITNELDGITIAFDKMSEADKDGFSRFLIELKPRFNEIGAVLAVDITKMEENSYDKNVVKNVADYIVEKK